MNIELTFGRSAKALRTAAGWSQRELADHCRDAGLGIDAAAVSRIESAERSLRLAEAETLATVLGSSIADMTASSANEATRSVNAIIESTIVELMALKAGAL